MLSRLSVPFHPYAQPEACEQRPEADSVGLRIPRLSFSYDGIDGKPDEGQYGNGPVDARGVIRYPV
ncbi:MAG: hypothetical protein ACRD52_00780 [Candidatus Acidiferrales bacterium]